jgi:hypothetical protein
MGEQFMSQAEVNVAAQDFAKSLRQIYTTVVDAALASQERNVQFARSIFEHGVDELKSQSDTARDVVQSVAQQASTQRATVESLAQQSVDAYMDYLQSVISFYAKGLEAVRQATE